MESIKSTYLIEPKFVEEGVVYPALVVGHALTPRVLEETEACGLSSLQIGDMITESLGAPTVVVSSLPVAVPTLNHRVLEELCIAGSSKVMEEGRPKLIFLIFLLLSFAWLRSSFVGRFCGYHPNIDTIKEWVL